MHTGHERVEEMEPRGILLGISRHKCDAIHYIVKDLRTQKVLILLQHCIKKQEN